MLFVLKVREMSEMQMHFAHFAIRNGDGVFYKHCAATRRGRWSGVARDTPASCQKLSEYQRA